MFQTNPLRRSVSYVISEKIPNITHSGSTLVIMKKQKTLQLLVITKNTRNKQQKKDYGKKEKGIDPEVNKIASCGKKWKKMFHALHNVEMCTCYAKQKINLPYPYCLSPNFIQIASVSSKYVQNWL